MKFNLPKNIKYVLDTLIKNGHKAYIVGGCVRDLLCGKTPHDYDVATSALPHETQSLFKKTIATGLKHGTVTVMLDGHPIEVTTFRTEDTYDDNRHPENVSFVTDVRKDLSRRDFTVNAMCYNESDGLIDLFGGIDDIKNKTLRAVGDAETRFKEDALRILRLFRFSATLEFYIEKNTFDAAIKHSNLLKNISAERIFTELQKTAMGNNAPIIVPLLQTNALQGYCLEANDLSALKTLPLKQNLRVFTLLYLTSNNLSLTVENLKCSNAFKEYCFIMSSLATHDFTDNKISIKKALNFADYDIVCDALIYYREILNRDVSTAFELLDEIITQKEPYKISHLDISGNDITTSGLSGKQIGEKLNNLLQEVIKNPALNKREKLLKIISN
ncbi:MAG: CCA tRNA nucleotidyltransferase [Clostridia bacterium]|nr:CCA tRNA nucleotidyltransferase [Clostridia bacterium]